ncbi:receptor-like serine/threonine-protein kinase sd1-8 [Phtheirospermum japonicum]|uniref:Receptor-like serine/threonine-protein kinase n=1 Tax=Phtheirospermum japonicum TaxID=374723 RepID=A0A830BGQ5_9LAMI|nr:receptor-like serine/threonine-protein kinase sd1-8 [Phtheirospermum japonicum]
MRKHNPFFSFFITTFTLLPLPTLSTNLISPTQFLTGDQVLVSSQQEFELGFFPSNNNNSWYIGICYTKISEKTVVWVANRDSPLRNPSGILKISPDDGNLVLVDQKGEKPVWSTRFSGRAENTVAELLDSGNFVLRRENDESPENYLWQSFDYPTDTLLPGMKLGWDSKTGLNRFLTSWKSPGDPSTGDYSFRLNTSGFPEIYLMDKQAIDYRSGPWNGLRFSGVPEMKASPLISFIFMMGPDEISYSFKLNEKSVYSRLVMKPNGELQRLTWIPTSGIWNLFWYAPKDQCDDYRECGVYGICDTNASPVCKCMKGFGPRNPQAWSLRDGSDGCFRERRLDCDTDGFLKMTHVKLPESGAAFVDRGVDLDRCREMCRRNCSCRGYSDADIAGGGSGCAIWAEDLYDMRQYAAAEGGQDFYFRVAAADLDQAQAAGSGDDFDKTGKTIMIAGITIGIFLLGLAFFFLWMRCKSKTAKGNIIQQRGPRERSRDLINTPTIPSKRDNHSSENVTEELDLPLFDFTTLIIATDNFSDANKLEKDKSSMLEWQTRFNIICGIARGLLYLHQDSRFRIIHRDLKASNVLLDKEMNPKISDFGMARIFGGDQTEGEYTKRVVGTYGYMSPEYAMDGLFSVKSDVFSFGVLVLEIVSGTKNRGFYQTNNQLNLLAYAWKLYREGKGLELIDTSAGESYSAGEVMRCIQVGLLCVQEHAEDRPNMSAVVLMLSSDCVSMPQPKHPGYCTGRRPAEAESSSSRQDETCTVNEVTVTMLDGR